MKKVTVCFLRDGDNVCLGMKKRGFGVGKWNGIGGKVEEGETRVAAAIREVYEEIGVVIPKKSIKEVGTLTFYFLDKPDWNQQMHIFVAEKWRGEPIESEEMSPKWFAHHAVPFEQMWIDDIHWLPHVLKGRRVQGEFHLENRGSAIERHVIEFYTPEE